MRQSGHKYIKLDDTYIKYKKLTFFGTQIEIYYPLDNLSWDELEDKIKNNGIEKIFLIRGYADKSVEGFENIPNHSVWVNLDRDIDEIMMSLKKETRNGIRQGYERGVTIKLVPPDDDKSFEEFWKIYMHTCKRGGVSTIQPKIKLNQIFKESDLSKLFMCYNKNIPISAFLVIYSKDIARFYFGGGYKDYFHLRPNNVGHWEIIKYFHDMKLKRYDLGGVGYSDNYHFKKGWGETVTMYKIKKILCSKVKYQLFERIRTSKLSSIYYQIR